MSPPPVLGEKPKPAFGLFFWLTLGAVAAVHFLCWAIVVCSLFPGMSLIVATVHPGGIPLWVSFCGMGLSGLVLLWGSRRQPRSVRPALGPAYWVFFYLVLLSQIGFLVGLPLHFDRKVIPDIRNYWHEQGLTDAQITKTQIPSPVPFLYAAGLMPFWLIVATLIGLERQRQAGTLDGEDREDAMGRIRRRSWGILIFTLLAGIALTWSGVLRMLWPMMNSILNDAPLTKAAPTGNK